MLRCLYQGWAYDHDGKLKAAPHFGECDWFNKDEHSLKPVRIGTWRGVVFVNVDGKAADLTDFLSDVAKLIESYPIESFQRRDGADLAIKCNWKTYTDNFVKGYHIPGIHPFLSQAIDFERFETTYGKHVVIMRAPDLWRPVDLAEHDAIGLSRWHEHLAHRAACDARYHFALQFLLSGHFGCDGRDATKNHRH